MPRIAPDYAVGDVVTWIPGKEYDRRMKDKGPFVVTQIQPGEEYCTAISDMRTGNPVNFGCSAYFSWRFKKDVFLSESRKAVADAKSR